MDIKDAVKLRHTVRKYTATRISEETAARLEERAAMIAKEQNLEIGLFLDDINGTSGMGKMVSKNANNYFAIAGEDTPDVEVRAGYAAADLMLYAQTIGLNTWYIGGMTNRDLESRFPGKEVVTSVAVGYGVTQGEPHKTRTSPEKIADLKDAPQWFRDGVEATMYAPTAMNRQKFRILRDGNKVKVDNGNGHFQKQDRGLIMYHFEVFAGKENFEWDLS